MRAPKNVTFRGDERRSYKNHNLLSPYPMHLTRIFPVSRTVTAVATLVVGLSAGPSLATKPRPLMRPGTAWPVSVTLVAGPEPRLLRWRGRNRPLDPPDFVHHGYRAELPKEMDDVVESR